MNANQTPLVDLLRLHAEDLYSDYGHNKSARLLSQAADEIERLRSSALALEDEKNDYMDGVGDVLGQDHDGETLWAAAQRVLSERDKLRTENADLLTDLDRVLTTLRYLIGIAERGEGRPMTDDETAESFVLGYVKRLEAELRKPDCRLCGHFGLSGTPILGRCHLPAMLVCVNGSGAAFVPTPPVRLYEREEK